MSFQLENWRLRTELLQLDLKKKEAEAEENQWFNNILQESKHRADSKKWHIDQNRVILGPWKI